MFGLRRWIATGVCASGVGLWAAETQFWQQSSKAEFEKGVLERLALRSDGRLTLGPETKELYDSPSAYLWTVARDAGGNVYAGGGPGAKLLKVTPSGQTSVLKEFAELQIQVILPGPGGQLYVATSPDGKVYEVQPDGASRVFYEPQTKYIWALARNAKGELFVGTGDKGEVHKVTAAGSGSVFFRTGETHARALAVDREGRLVIGTEPSGLVIRVEEGGKGFVLHQTAKREVTALALGPDGSIYAAAVGTKQAAPVPAAPVAPAPAAPAAAPAAAPMAARPPAGVAVPVPPAPVTITGGSEVVRIEPDGYPRKFWTHAQDIAYTLAVDAQGRAWVGTGNKGAVYRLDSEALHTLVWTAPPTQVTAFAVAGETLFAGTGNPGKVYQIGPKLVREGTIESDVLDAEVFSAWGRLRYRGRGAIALSGRSGNVSRPGQTWTEWSAPIPAAEGGRPNVAPARFFQWKATLTGDGVTTPEIEWVELAYLQKNIAPLVEALEETPPNYRFPPAAAAPAVKTLSLPAFGQAPRPAGSKSGAVTFPTMQWAKGYLGARWRVSDLNNDTLVYRLEIRGAGETTWKLLKDEIHEAYYSWDSTAFPDGEYRLRLTASDAPSNPKGEALTAQRESDVVLVDNTPPRITELRAQREGPRLRVEWKAADAWTVVTRAEYSLDGGEWLPVAPAGGLADAREAAFALEVTPAAAGELTVAVRVEDEFGNQSTEKVVVR